ncbi:PF20097 family protein [uncultured Holdemanella sp.]
MQCPYCNQEMGKGYIQSARPFMFTLKMKGIFLFRLIYNRVVVD